MFFQTHNVSRHTLFMEKWKKKKGNWNWNVVASSFSAIVKFFHLLCNALCLIRLSIDLQNLDAFTLESLWRIDKVTLSFTYDATHTAVHLLVFLLSKINFFNQLWHITDVVIEYNMWFTLRWISLIAWKRPRWS